MARTRILAAIGLTLMVGCFLAPGPADDPGPPEPKIVIDGERVDTINWLYLLDEISRGIPIPIETPEGDVVYVAFWPSPVSDEQVSLTYTGQVLGRRLATARLSATATGIMASIGIDGRTLYIERVLGVPEGREVPEPGWSYHRFYWADMVRMVVPKGAAGDGAFPGFSCETIGADE